MGSLFDAFSHNAMLLGSNALSRTILALYAFRGSAINFVQGGTINIATKCTLYGFQIGLVAVRSELDAVGGPVLSRRTNSTGRTSEGGFGSPWIMASRRLAAI